MQGRRVVITGLGLVSPLGQTVESSWQAALAGKSGVATIRHFDASALPVKISATSFNDFNSTVISAKEQRRLDTFVCYAAEAAEQAYCDAGFDESRLQRDRVGVAIGSGIGGLPWIRHNALLLAKSGPRKISPFFIPGGIINMASGYVAMKKGLQGPNISMATACTTGTHSIGLAARMIAYGDAEVMIAGGTEMSTEELGMAGFASLRALSTRNDDPTAASRPWDKDRDGFVMADGAGVLVLEEYEHAKARGARIYAEFLGLGMSGDAYHMTAAEPSGRGFVASMEAALRDAGTEPSEIDYINAHGTSTPLADPIEACAVKQMFGDHAYKLAVSSTKSMTGHLLGAAGAIEAIFSALALRDQVAPPTINLENPAEGCDLDFVAGEAQPRKLRRVMSNSFGFGGTNGTVILGTID